MMQVAKYWRNNNLRYRLEGIVQNKADRTTKAEPVKLEPPLKQEKNMVASKVDVA